MKLFSKYFLALVAAGLLFTACDDDDDFSAGKPTAADCPALTFGTDNSVSLELEPDDPSDRFDVNIYRNNATNAATYNIVVLENTDGVYNVPATVSFGQGETESSITVTYSGMEVGTQYDLAISFDDDDVDAYSEDTYNIYTYSVIHIKWNLLGTGQWLEDFWYGFWAEVEIEERDDQPGLYRIKSPYTDELVIAWGGVPATYQEYLIFKLDSDDTVSWDDFFYFNSYNTSYGAEMLAWYPSAFSSSYASYNAYSYAVRDDDGQIEYLQICPRWYMTGIGGWIGYYCYIAFPGVDLATRWNW